MNMDPRDCPLCSKTGADYCPHDKRLQRIAEVRHPFSCELAHMDIEPDAECSCGLEELRATLDPDSEHDGRESK